MELNFKVFNIDFMQPKYLFGLFFIIALVLIGCNNYDENIHKDEISYIIPIDSIEFNYNLDSLENKNDKGYKLNLYGQHITVLPNQDFRYTSITSQNELHTFYSSTNRHVFSDPVLKSKIDAYKVDSSYLYLLSNNTLYKKDHKLNTVDSFKFITPTINKKHGVDFSLQNNSNLFKIKDYFILLYYVVERNTDNSSVYKNTNPIFYYFNRDTSYFAGSGCKSDSTYQYFRYPAIAADSNFLYHAPRVLNCISKSNEFKTLLTAPIDTLNGNYLTINYDDQYQISKLKRYRFTTDYNKDIIVTKSNLFLLKEYASKIFYRNNIRNYNRNIELKKFDKKLNLIKTYHIKNNKYSYALIKKGKLYLLSLRNNKCYIYEI
ncbi:hypothetical protein [Salibacter sp.]|uniref:hypothetical protein n=1 Tax=Salibacter sp. TaxID=2010995 RepID=UPI00286FE8FB|nr:hypothetical protein [Salibacter sp.]MDR9399715.1 hypothetical protein [Salibacter sp.]MDR9487741.1 hypothetical protein [Salibacter sp.]